MRLEFSVGKITNLFSKDKKNIFNLGMIIFTLIIIFNIYKNHADKIESLKIKKGIEIKKNEVLNEIVQSEKKIKYYKSLLTKKDPATFMNTINNLTKDFNLTLLSAKPGAEENQPLYIKYPFILVIGADSYHALGKFISKIESHPDTYFVDAISIRSQEEDRKPDRESARMPKTSNKLIVDLILSIIAFKG